MDAVDKWRGTSLCYSHHRGLNMKLKVIGCPKTIDGDLKSKEVPISFGFDTACKVPPRPIGPARSHGLASLGICSASLGRGVAPRRPCQMSLLLW